MGTIADKLTKLITTKGAIKQAIIDKGVSVSDEDTFASYADKIGDISGGSGETVQATNYTGSAVSTGDKIFIKENVAVEGDRAQVYSSSASSIYYYYIVNPTGTKVFYHTYVYDIASGTTENSSYDGSGWTTGSYPLHYDSYGNLFAGKYILGESQTELSFACIQDDYAMPFVVGSISSSFVFRKIDKTDFSVAQSWTVSMSSSVYYPVSCVIGDKLYVSTSYGSTGDRYIGTIDENSATISMNARSDDYVVAYSTADNALAICAKGSTPIYSCKWEQVVLVSIDSNYELDSVFVSSNNDLRTLQGESTNFVVFNRNTGVLCIGNNGSNDYYGVFKYNTITHDFDTVALVLPDYSTSEYKIMTTTTDLSKIQLNNYIYNLTQVGGGYKALAYQPNLGSDVLTGIAEGDAAVGATFNVTTILP